jgi:hypothetical protein
LPASMSNTTRRQGRIPAPAGPASSSAPRQAGQPRQRRRSELTLTRTGAGAPLPARGHDHRRVDRPLTRGPWPQRGSSSRDRLRSLTRDGDVRRRSSPPRRRHPPGATVAAILTWVQLWLVNRHAHHTRSRRTPFTAMGSAVEAPAFISVA